MTSTNNPKDLPLLCWRAIFRNEPFIYKGQFNTKDKFRSKNLRFVRVKSWMYIEQSKYTGSSFARMAKSGKELVQIIFDPNPKDRTKKGTYWGWFDGQSLTKYDRK